MSKISRKTFLKRSALGLLALALIDALWIERYFVEWKKHTLSWTDKGIRAVQISDLHLQKIGSLHRNLLQKIEKKAPDVLFITGDAIDKASKLKVLESFLQELPTDLPKFAILGNWEYWGKVDIPQLKTLYQRYNCQLLVNEHVQIRLKDTLFTVVGLDDYLGGEGNWQKASEDLPPADYCLVLNHCPAYREQMALEAQSGSIDLVLSGHTHGGQLNLLGWAPFRPPGSGRYIKGWYQDQGPLTYVSKGIGTSVLPLRLGARAEVTEFVL